MEFGTTNNKIRDDYDLWAIFRKVPPEGRRKEIIEKLNSSGFRTHLFFINKKDFDCGKIIPANPAAPLIENLLEDGLKDLATEYAFRDASLLSLYIYSTMRPFYLAKNLNSKIGLNSIRITRQGIIDWVHYYTACFLDNYLNKKEALNYSGRLSKYLIRVVLGNTLIETSERNLPKMKKYFIKYLKGEPNHSLDQKIVNFIHKYGSSLLSKEDLKTLYRAGVIRDKSKPGNNKFLNEGESLLFYSAFQHGSEIRQESQNKYIENILGYAADLTIWENLAELGSKKVALKDKQVIMKKGIFDGGDLFYIPVVTTDKKGNSIRNKGSLEIFDSGGNILDSKGPGRITGEVSALFGCPRTANVRAKENLWTYKIKGNKFRKFLSDPEVKRGLRKDAIPKKSRLMDIFLRYLVYEPSSMLRSLTRYSDLPPDFRETHRTICFQNPLAGYYLGNGFLEAMETLMKEHYSYNGKLLLRKVPKKDKLLFSKGDKIEEGLEFYIVASGKVVLSDITPSGDNVFLEKGSVFGEAGLLRKKTRSGTAKLEKETKLFAINANVFNRFVNSRLRKIKVNVSCDSKPVYERIYPQELLYHLAALGLGRVRQRVVKN
jgi:CRP-like cAMP-binding protein